MSARLEFAPPPSWGAALGDLIHERRIKLGMSTGEVARRTGYSHQTISAIERGSNDGYNRAIIVVAVCDVLGIDTGELGRLWEASR